MKKLIKNLIAGVVLFLVSLQCFSATVGDALADKILDKRGVTLKWHADQRGDWYVCIYVKNGNFLSENPTSHAKCWSVPNEVTSSRQARL